MKFTELQNMDSQALQEKLTELRKDLMKMNAQVAVGTVPKNPGQIRQTRRAIARILHMLKLKQRGAVTPQKSATAPAQKKTQGGQKKSHG